ncbi:MAG: hypothetical protein LH647_07560 [Leptolyngbyaceae cyanobacterium CAN_BIN12]|nr:hypothetical protein [Leptolyngbyaceae cyanobacterium CAN_BIN12]
MCEFESRQSLQIKFPPEADIVTRCADNAVVAGAVPAWWISTQVEFWGGRLNGMATVETECNGSHKDDREIKLW